MERCGGLALPSTENGTVVGVAMTKVSLLRALDTLTWCTIPVFGKASRKFETQG